MRCQFEIACVEDNEVHLRDLDGPVSITNDAEQVMDWCRKTYPGHRLIYSDTEGIMTEIVDKPHTTWMGTTSISFRILG